MTFDPVALLSSYVDEIIGVSELPPKATSYLRETLTKYLEDQLINHGDDYPLLVKELYSLNDNQHYSLLALASDYTGYHLFLFPQEALIMGAFKRDYMKWIKATFVFENGAAIGAMVKKVEDVFKTFREINADCIRTRRSATGYGEKPIGFPSEEELQRFYECERKKSYDTLEEALAVPEKGKEPYVCNYCSKYHRGAPRTGDVIPHDIVVGRWKTTYRRKLKI